MAAGMDAAGWRAFYQVFFFSSRRRHTRYWRDWSSDVCSSDLGHAYVGEGSIAIVAVELWGRGSGVSVPGPVFAIHQKNVGITVVVVINEGAARSHRDRKSVV